MLLFYTASDTSFTTKWVPMFTDISVVPTSEVRTVAMSVYVSVTTETSFWSFWAHGVESSWNVMAHVDARQGKWRGNWLMEWVAGTLLTPSEHGVSSITTADAHTTAASSRLNWRPCRFKWTRPLRRKTKSGFCACAITFQTQSTTFLDLVK